MATKKNALKGKGGLIMLAVVAGLGVLYFFDQKAPPPRDPDSEPPVSEFAHVTSKDVRRVEIKRSTGGFTLVKEGDRWVFEAPSKVRANTETVDTWLKGLLEDATVSRSLKGQAESISSYGLDKPAGELVLTTKGGDTRTLQVGKSFSVPGEAADSSTYYAREAKDGRLFMLTATQADDITKKKSDDLRDKRLLDVGEEKQIQKIVIQRAAGTLEVQRRGEDRWDVVQPFQAPAESADVTSLVSQVKSAEAESFVEAGGDLAKYGLAQPRLTVRVTDKKGTHTVNFGNALKDGKVYAAREGESEVTLVSKFTFESFDKKASDLRDRKLITLEEDKISSLDLTNAHGNMRLQKVGKEWQFADATDPKEKKAKAESVEQILTDLRASADRHVEEAPTDLAKYGLDKPVITAQVNDGRGKTQILAVGKKTPGGNYYAKGTGPAVFEVQAFVFDGLNVKRESLKDTGAPPAAGNAPAGGMPGMPAVPPAGGAAPGPK